MSVKSSFDAQLGWVLRTVDDSVREYLLQIGFSDVSEHLRIAALGNNPVVPSTTTVAAPQDIWSGSGVYPLIPSARGLRVRSTSVEDGPAGTGAASVSANFLDGQYNVEAAVVTILNGITPVNIAGSHLRIQSALPVSKGAAAPYSATNVGDLIIEDQDAPNTVRAIIPAGYGFTRQAVFTVPTGYTAQVVSHVTGINRLSGGVQQFATIGLLFRNGVTGVHRLPLELPVSSAPYRHDGMPGTPVPEKTDVIMRCTSASANIDLTAALLGVLKKNTV